MQVFLLSQSVQVSLSSVYLSVRQGLRLGDCNPIGRMYLDWDTMYLDRDTMKKSGLRLGDDDGLLKCFSLNGEVGANFVYILKIKR